MLVSAQILTFLGFVLNSVAMTVQLTKEHKEKLKNACQKLAEVIGLNNIQHTNLAEVIGLIVSSLPGEVYGPLHYWSLERNKTDAFRENKGH